MQIGRKLFGLTMAVAASLGCHLYAKTLVTKTSFGKMEGGAAVDLYTLKNGKLEATITNYGATVVTLRVPDRAGKPADIVLGYDRLHDYVKDTRFFGCVVGRYGNRIAHGKFSLDGHEYKLWN